MIDTHAHLDFEDFDEDREEVIRRAFDNGVKRIVNVGVDLERSRKSIEIAENHTNIFASVGFHPDYFTKHTTRSMEQNWVNELKKLAKHEKVRAIGETGLDYYHIIHNIEHGTKEIDKIKMNQKKGFIEQIKLAQEFSLPIIVHCREAWNDLYEVISNYSDTKFVLHCYSGNKKDTEKFLKLPNIYFSFSGNITYPKPTERAEKLAQAIRMISLERMILDSDAPFLSPQAMRGKRNEPAHVRFIAEKIAEIKEISAEEVERATDQSAAEFFGI